MLLRVRLFRTPDSPSDNREFRLDAIRMGRAPSADFVIPDDSAQTVSWQHARIDATPDGAILHDLKSTNGTYLNGRRVERPERLRVGDQIRFGQTGPMLEVVLIEAVAPQVPAPYEQQTYIPPSRPAAPPPVRPSRPDRMPQSHPVHPAQMSATRALLVGMQKKQRKWVLFGVGGLVVAGLVIGIMLLRHEFRLDSHDEEIAAINKKFLDEETDADTVDSQKGGIERGTREHYDRTRSLDDKVKSGRAKGEVIYQRTVLSTAWVISDAFEGTGTVIDNGGKKLIVTSYHGISGSKKIAVIFPKFLNDKILANHGQYLRSAGGSTSDSVPCNVWASDPGVDLAILEPIGIPDYICSLTLAEKTVAAGADVHTVGGNPGGTNALWSYTRGTVRQVAGPVDMVFRTGQKVRATIVETQNPVNQGDSGGPLVNNKCELVGVTAGGVDGVNLVTRFIEVGHVKDVLRTRPQLSLTRPEAPKRPSEFNPPPIKTPPPSKRPSIPNPPKTAPDSGGNIHVLMVIDDRDSGGLIPGVQANERMMTSLLQNGLPPGRTSFETLNGKRATWPEIEAYYTKLRTNPNDTVMFYYAGHGCTDSNFPHPHYFTMTGWGRPGRLEFVHRGRIMRLMQGLGCRLTVLLSDCCSSYSNVPANVRKETTAFARGSYMVPLLLKHHGLVDIQAASPKECGWYRSDGGWFTRSFCQTCETGAYSNWDQLFQEAKRRTVEFSRPILPKHPEAKKIGQTQQTPYRFDWMRAIPD